MPKHSFNTLMRRLSHAGFKRQFVTTALMPDWWEDSYAQDPAVLPEVEIRVAQSSSLAACWCKLNPLLSNAFSRPGYAIPNNFLKTPRAPSNQGV